ncbi:hypothetical protein U9M48_030066 [Paspalum notatum var. saurae]|uniref:DYW domain-containing protein n=1 Tax=Paspalum notatum var. saurae TaxID=547442 RepID=A0AAQ3U286_PASNO
MAPYPSPPPQQQLHPAHGTAPHHVRGNTSRPDTVPSSSSLRHGAPTDARGLRALIKTLSVSSSSSSHVAPAVHAHAAKLGMDRERTVRNGLIALYLARGERAAAGALFQHGFPDGGRDVVSWTSMVTGHARLGLAYEAVALFFAMFDDGDGDPGFSVDAVAAAAGFAACADAKDLALAREAHRRVAAAKVDLDAVAWNALLDMYAKCGDVAAARRLFEAMPVAKTVVSWNTMIAALSRAGAPGDALALFREMQRAAGAPRPDDATLVAALGACARLGALDAGRWVHALYARTRRGGPDGGVAVGNALVDMYAKCGAVDQAAGVFRGMARRDVCSYASMILGLATHGRAGDAFAVFEDMRRAGVRPNGVALLGVLSACCHAGLVDEGLRHLRAMAETYGVAPGVEHYGCAVDMLGRAGRLDEAEALVAAMPVPPDAIVRGSLLAACRARGDVERAERVMRRLVVAVDGDGDEAGDHVLLANTYASKGRYGRAVRVRKEMRRKRIVKDPGCSFIEIDGVIHEFRAVFSPKRSCRRRKDRVEIPGPRVKYLLDDLAAASRRLLVRALADLAAAAPIQRRSCPRPRSRASLHVRAPPQSPVTPLGAAPVRSGDQDASNSLPQDIDPKERKRQRDRERWATMSAEKKNEKNKRRREARQRNKGQPMLPEISKDGEIEEDDEWLHRNETYEPYNIERGDLALAAADSTPSHGDNNSTIQFTNNSTDPMAADDDDSVIFEEDDEDDEGYLFVGQEEDTDEEADVEETQDDSSSIPNVPDLYDKVYSNMPKQTHTLRHVSNCGHCNAKKFEYEPPGFCCHNGKIDLAP